MKRNPDWADAVLWSVVFVAAVGLSARCANADVVHFTDGSVQSGKVVRSSATTITVDTGGFFRGITYPLSKVSSTDAARYRAMPIVSNRLPAKVQVSEKADAAPQRIFDFAELSEQIADNALRVERDLAQQKIRLRGKVSEIGGTRRAPHVFFRSENASGYVHSCRVDLLGDQFDKAADLRAGDTMIVDCYYSGIQILPVFSGGRIVQ
jgi:hypothetical protein